MKSLKDEIYSYLRSRPNVFINGGELERFTLTVVHKKKNGSDRRYKASNGSRRARELAEDEMIKGEIINGSVWYKYIPSTYETFHQQMQQRTLL